MVKQKVEQEGKWGKMFAGEEMVPLFIPQDHLNPQKQRWLAINGQEIVLAVGEQLLVPESVAALWRDSYERTQEAERLMDAVVEINA